MENAVKSFEWGGTWTLQILKIELQKGGSNNSAVFHRTASRNLVSHLYLRIFWKSQEKYC